jgi:hypothetical protein
MRAEVEHPGPMPFLGLTFPDFQQTSTAIGLNIGGGVTAFFVRADRHPR